MADYVINNFSMIWYNNYEYMQRDVLPQTIIKKQYNLLF